MTAPPDGLTRRKADAPKRVCRKCGVDHDNPGGEQRAIQVLACVLGGEFDFVTKDGPVAQPHREAGIA